MDVDRGPSRGIVSSYDREWDLVGLMRALETGTLELGTWLSEAGLGTLSKRAMESPEGDCRKSHKHPVQLYQCTYGETEAQRKEGP